MKKHASPVQYTVRGVPTEVDLALRQEAAKRKRSLNHLIIELLTEAAAGARKRPSFLDLVGTWPPDPAFDEIIASTRQIASGHPPEHS